MRRRTEVGRFVVNCSPRPHCAEEENEVAMRSVRSVALSFLLGLSLLAEVGCSSSEGGDDATSSSSGDTSSVDASASSSGSSGASSGSSGASSGSSGDPDSGPTRCASPPCDDGEACIDDPDCKSTKCIAHVCAPPTCADGVKNGDETDVDCGGSCPTKCAPTKGCAAADDCVEGVCGQDDLCAAPTSTDGVKNGNETDVDCGSAPAGVDTGAPGCDAGKICIANGDCKSAGCNHAKRCAWARSCTVEHGGTTCGTAGATEDCCASAEVPTYDLEGYANATAFRLDKYQITSGRIRRFLDAVNGNVQKWVQDNRASVLAPNQLPVALDPYLPAGWTQPNSDDDCLPETGQPSIKCNYGALNQVSGYRYHNHPGGNTGYGCYMGTGGYGSRTFWMSAAESVHTGEIQHSVPRERVEEKAMTCATYYILAAFCAWDGGRLETFAEYNAAYGGGPGTGRTFPWGSEAASRAIGFSSIGSHVVAPTNNYGYLPPADATNGQYSVFNAGLSADQKAALVLRLQRGNVIWNYAGGIVFDYRAPLEGRARAPLAESLINVANDQSVAVAPPGRYPMGEGRYGHRDLYGNVMEITAPAATAAASTRKWTRNGSFETSHFNHTTVVGNNYGEFNHLTKYGRTGGRCARPAAAYPVAVLPEAPAP
jgi:formylglycine-generating enzyme required for sulfatase activity